MPYQWLISRECEVRHWTPSGGLTNWVELRTETKLLRRQYRTPNDAEQARRAFSRKFPGDAKWSLQQVTRGRGEVATRGGDALQVGSNPIGHRDTFWFE